MGDRLTGVNRHQGCIIAATILLSIIFSWQAASHSSQPAPPTTPAEDNGARQLPARAIPVPTTVSPELQKAIAKPLGPNERFWSTAPKRYRRMAETHRTNRKGGYRGGCATAQTLRGQGSEPNCFRRKNVHCLAGVPSGRESEPCFGPRPWRGLCFLWRRSLRWGSYSGSSLREDESSFSGLPYAARPSFSCRP